MARRSSARGSSPRLRGTRACLRDIEIVRGIIPALAGNTNYALHPPRAFRDHPRACGEHNLQLCLSTEAEGSSPRLRGTPPLCGRPRGSPRDHPRACGEHVKREYMRPYDEGSSPRLRGTPFFLLGNPSPAGIIPALAGNTRFMLISILPPWDHPRACGEHESGDLVPDDAQGSSPRLRGTPSQRYRFCVLRWIIPALAGNTPLPASRTRRGRDHPRACGEHAEWGFSRSPSAGSSPRLRGTPRRGAQEPRVRGIIPALAGNTLYADARLYGERDHPRACGEHPSKTSQTVADLGSSPRLRGTLPHAEPRVAGRGIIPALAGNTYSRIKTHIMMWDHPRACGEHSWLRMLRMSAEGSSPRLRGTREAEGLAVLRLGIIPALAGNTRGTRTAPRSARDHPRACGEHSTLRTNPHSHTGSSPRLRGTLLSWHGLPQPLGIIPALAGNTRADTEP